MNRLQTLSLRMKRVLTVLPAALLLMAGVLCALPQPVQAATSSVPEMIPSTGKDFWLTYMYNFGQNNDDVDLEIFVVAMRSDAVVTITTGDGTVLASAVAVPAGSAYTLTIPTLLRDKVYNTSSDVKKKTGVHVQASSEVAVYFRNGYSSGSDYSYDNSHAISTDALGTEYMIQTYYRDMMNNEFAIVATADGTTVEVSLSTAALKPSESPTDLYDAGTILTRSLNAGEVIQIKGARYNSSGRGDLSGTTIKSNKPVAVFNGGAKASVPLNTGYNGDHTVDPAIPVSAWGKRFVAMEMSGFPDRKSTDDGGLVEASSPTQYMLTAMYDGTQVKVDGQTICTLNKGENIPYDKISSMYYSKIRVDYNETPKLVETSNPVVLYAYMSSGAVNAYDYEVFSEPALALIPDVNKGVDTSYIYCAPTPSSIHFANVVVPASGVSDMKLNGVDVSSEFTTLSGTFDGYSKNYAYARLSLNSGVNILANKSAKFVAVSYSTEMYAAISEASVTAFNLAPIAPIMFIDDNEIVHGATMDYCNRHPGVHFTAVVDYPHDSVKWVLGEGAESTDYETSHMYGINVGEEDKKHDVKLFVYRESPIMHIKDTDSICVTLDVHPVYYDTLKTKVAANKLEYIWNKSSNPAFGLAAKGELSVGPVTMGKNAPNANNKWTSANDSMVIFDSLVYATRHGCDSIFYLQLQVVPDIIINDPAQSICQEETFNWIGHAPGAGHKIWQGGTEVTTAINTATAGVFEIRDTLVSKVFPYPDSIHVMNLTVYVKPTMGLTAPGAICQTDDDELQVAYTTTDANRFTYSLKNSSDDEVKSGTINAPGATGTLTITDMSTLPNGAYKLYATAYSEHDCHSVEASVDVTINVKPTLTLNDIDPQCYPAAAFEVSYDHTNATKVFYRVLQGGALKKAWTEAAVVTAKKFTISTEGWDAATYTVQAYSQSADGCQSVQKEKTFTIIVQPTVTSVTVANACDAETVTELAFTTAHAATYNYYIVGQTALKATPVATTDGAHTADLDISMLAAGDYTLKIVANSTTCKSDTVAVGFTIYPIPTAAITSTTAELNACAPGTSNKTVNYTTTNASQIKWQLTTPHGVMNYDYAAVGTSLTIPQDSLVCPGTYKVKITGVKSAAPMNCEVLNPAGGEVTFTMYNSAAITLNDIAAVCSGNAVTSTYTAEYTDAYTYEVRTKTGSVLKGSGSSTTIDGTIDLSKTDTLPAGTYVLSVTATNTNNCGSSNASKEFVINPIPVINSLSTPDKVCETEVASRDVTFTATDAANILYTLKKGSAVWNAEKSVEVGAGKFTIKTDTLSAGDYTVEAKPVSGAGCTGAVRSVNFTVYPHPTITLPASLPNACFGEENLTINYSTTYASTYAYTLADKDGNALTPGSGAAVASGSIVVPLTATMTAAKSPYKFRIEVTSDKGCKSGWVEKIFTINPKPTAGITSVESKCDNETSAAVVYTSSNATKYEYRVFKSGVAAPVLTVTDQDVTGTTFNVNISTLDAGSYELRLVAKSATCESDTAKKAFDIWPLPLISTLDNTTPCEGEAVVNVPYTATNAQTFSYTVKDGETVVKTVASATVADGKIEVDIDGLTTGGAPTKAYTLSVMAVSEHNCAIAAAKVATITLKAKPTVTLNRVTNTCAGAGASITVTYSGMTTTKYDYIVRKAGADTPVSGSKTGVTPGDGSFTISGAAFEALAAGTDYEVELIAQGDNGCPSVGAEQLKAFTIYPLPTVAVKPGSEEITVCEGREDAVFEFTTSANASTYSYETGALGLTATDQTVVDQKIKITLPKAELKDGNYTLTVIVKSAVPQSCSSVAATATLKVNNRPWLKMNDLDAQCFPAESFSVAYTATDAAKIYWSVDGKIAEQTLTVAAPFNFTVNANGWAAGTYTLRARPESTLGCDSAAVVKTITIHPKPATPTNITIAEPCAGDAAMNVTFNKDALGNCAMAEIVETAQQTLAGTPVDATSRMIPVPVTGLTAGTYTLRIYTFNNTTNCQSDPVDKTFVVHPVPTIETHDTTAVHPVTAVDVRYSSTNAANYTYTLNGPGIDPADPRVGSGSAANAGMISVNTNGLNPGVYNLSVTVTSSHGCSKNAVSTITIFNATSIQIAHIDSVCKGDNIADVVITTTYANKYTYLVKNANGDDMATGTGSTTNNEGTPVNKSFSIATTTWEAGTYTLTVTAENTLTTAKCDASTSFTINPTPVITFTVPAAICESEVSSVNVTFTSSNAKTIKYHVDKLLPTPTADIVAEQQISANGTIALTGTNTWADGTYRIYATPTSQHGCVGEEKFVDLDVNNQPEVAITSMPTDVCFSDAYLNVTYTASTDARAYAFRILNAATDQPVSGYAGNGTISAPYGGGSFAVDVHSLPVGTYKMEVKTQTEPGCWSEASVQQFDVRTKPGATITSMQSVCEGTATATAEYTTTNATTYYYTVKGTSIEGNGTITGSGTISVDVSSLTAAGSPYTLQLVSKSIYCESDTATRSFAIRPIPVVAITSIDEVCFGDATTTVTYNPDANVSNCTYTLKQGATVLLADQAVTLNPAHTFTINTSALAVGTYTVELTPRSSYTCTGAMVSSTFKVNALPTLDDIVLDANAVCEGTATMRARFYHTGADSCHWEVREQGTTTVLRSGDKTGLSDGTTMVDIDLLAPTALAAGKTYDVRVTVINKTTTCEITKTSSFFIRKKPVVTINTENNLHFCQPVTELKVNYSNEDNRATVFHYEVLKGTDPFKLPADKFDVSGGDWTIQFGAPLLQGEYKLRVQPDNDYCPGDWKELTFHVDTVMPVVTNASICYGESYDWNVTEDCSGNPITLMRGLTTTTHQLDTLFCAGACVKVYELNLTVYPEYAGAEEQYTLCAGETLTWRGKTIADAGTYEYRKAGVAPNGCDSIYRITVDKIVTEYKSTDQTVCYGEPVLFNGKTYNNRPVGQQVLLDTLKSIGGCDSVYLRLNLTVGQRYYDSVKVVECERYVWPLNGQTYTHSGIYRENLASIDGCDSVCVLNLTINDAYEFYETYDILTTQLPFTVHEYTYTAAGTYNRIFTTVGGCDSIYHITLNVHPVVLPKDTLHKTVCEAEVPYNWRGTDYSKSGWYSKTTTVSGNDTIHYLHLTVNKTYSDTTYIHACGPYTWHGNNYAASGIYTFPQVSSCGCDSTEVLKLTVGAPSASTVNVTTCQYELTTIGNRTFVAMANTSFTETLTNATGCDSVVTYNVTVTPRVYTAPDDMYSFCEGTTYTWHGHTYDAPGTYYDSIADGNGCTVTVHTLRLTQNPAYHFEEDVEVSELALPYKWIGHKGDTLLSTNGDYYDRWLSQVGGCDSIYHIHFHVNFVTRNYDAALEGCESVTWSRNGKTYTESCLASDTVFTDAPTNTKYDVIYFCNVTVHHNFAEVEPDFTICRNEAFTWHGQNYEANHFTAGDHVLTYTGHTIHGCDSTYTATLHVVESFRNEASYDACPSELPYNWHGQLLTTAGQYTDEHLSVSGCDSVYVLNFTVKTVTAPDSEADLQCQGATITWQGMTINALIPGEFAYYKWYTAAGDCDSTYHKLNLTVGETYEKDSVLTKHICQGETFDWYEATRSVPQDGAHQVDDHTFVENFHYEKPSVLGCDSLKADLTLIMHVDIDKQLADTTVCNSYNWDGLEITTSGDYVKTYHPNVECFDSIVRRTFTVLYSEVENTVKDECNSYYWPRTQQVYTESGHYVHSVPQLGGLCDKIYTLDLTIRQTARDTAKILDWCHEFTWAANGTTYHTAAFDSVVYPGGASNGCDSVAYLYLTLDTDTVFHLPAVTACETYTWHGMTYTGSTLARYQTTKLAGSGCDSIVYLPITILHPTQVMHNLEGCRQLIWNNVTYTTSQVAVQNFECDSVVTLNITINHPDTINHVLHACESVTWNGQMYTYSQQTQQDFLCDSVVMLDITIDHVQTTDDYVTRWDSYTWEGDTYTATGNYTKTLTSACGCDSIVTLHLTINESESDEETQIACESFDWAWSGLTYTASGDYSVTNTIDLGLPTQRDSTRTLHLGIGHKKFRSETVTDVCDAYVWHGTEYLTSGTYKYEYNDTCDGNVDTLHLTLYHKSVPVEYYDTACDVLTINGHSYFNSTEFTETFQTVHGCDSVVNFHLTINHRQTKSISAEACGSYTWEGTTYTQSGVYSKVLTGANGCDSVVTLTLSLFPSYNSEFSVTSCDDHYIWGNMIIIKSGDYTKNIPSIKGCDSIVTLHLSLPTTIYSDPVIAEACDEYWWNGKRYTETGSYTETLTSLVTGCDSVARLNLNMVDHPTGEFSETAQEMYTWRDETYYESGDYVQRFPTAGCDSIVTLHLTITTPTPINEISATACDAYTWDSETFYESGTYTRNFPTLEGNDSIVKLTLTITHDTATSITAEACDTYVWNSVTYNESGIYTQTLQRGSGCDSVVTLNLTIHESFATSFTATARDVYTWDAETFTVSGTYTHTYPSVEGCDSTATLMLTIIGNEQSAFNAEACTEYAWADSVFTLSTIHSHVFPAANGCDSVVTMTLVINEPVYTDLYDTVSDCSDPLYAYTLPWGENVQHTGIYNDTLQSALTQCDSIVRFHLQWCAEPLCIDTVTFSVSDCESYVWEGQTYNTTGTYYRHYRLDNGCDSVSQLRLTIKPKAQYVIDMAACDSLYWSNTDTWYYESGFYYDTVPALNGCDSVVVLHAGSGKAAEQTIDRESCDALTINGETFSESGTYVQHLTTVTGCDSTLTINLTIKQSVDTVVADTACDNYLWHGQTLTATGYYPQVLNSAVSNCDSVVNLHLIVYGSKLVEIVDSLHCDSIVWGDEVSGIDTIYDDGIYTKTFHSAVGCDSTVTMDLRLLRHDIITANDTAACDSLVWNGDFFIYESGTYTDTLISAVTGCDSIITMNVTINPTLHVEIEDSVPPPFYLWPSELDTIWSSGVYVDTTASLVTGCDSITTLTLVMTDSIILDPIEPVRIDTFGYCPGDTMNFVYNLIKGHPTKYRLVFDTIAVAIPDYTRQFQSVLDTTELPNHGLDSLFTIVIPEYCPAGVYCAELQLFDDFSSSEIYQFCIRVNLKGYLVSMWTDVVAINNFEEKYIGYQWYKDDVEISGADKQYYSDGEDLNACYRAKVQLAADSSWVFTCEECFDLRTDSLELIVYPTPAPVGQPVTIKAMGILLEKLIGSRLTITNVQGLPVHTVESMTRREEEVGLPAGLYIATIVTGENDDRVRTASVKFTVF